MTISLEFLDDPDGLNMSGRQRIVVKASPTPKSYEIYVDDKLIGSLTKAVNSYSYTLDTTAFSDGTHRIRAEAVYRTRRARTEEAVTVKNSLSAGAYGAGAYGEGPYGG